MSAIQQCSTPTEDRTPNTFKVFKKQMDDRVQHCCLMIALLHDTLSSKNVELAVHFVLTLNVFIPLKHMGNLWTITS